MQYPTGGFFNAELPFAPDLSLNGYVRYEWPAFDGTMSAITSFTSVGPHYFDVANEPIVHEDRYFTADARLTYRSDAGWDVSAWVKNLTDEQYRTFALDIGTLSLGNQAFAPPRWAGVSFGYEF